MAEEEKPIPPADAGPTPAAEQALSPKPDTAADNAGSSRLSQFKTWYTNRKKWTIPASILLLIILLAAVPFTRYSISGLAIKHDLTVKVLDDTANTPVSGADVSVGSLSAQTNSAGMATLHKVKPGHHKVSISKKYYKSQTADFLVPVFGNSPPSQISLNATGRQVKVTVLNAINKQPLTDAVVKVADVTSKTDKTGSTVIVLPAGSTEQKGTVSLSGYNQASVTVKISSDKIQDNVYNLTPAGKVYFLSKLSGKIDVVKTNLDGSARQTVLAGTGNEDDNNTVLLASRDWKYLALLSRRAGSSATLYLIDTSNDSLTTIDEGSADFSLAGWIDDSFVYTLTRSDVPYWQPQHQALKSYNALSKKLIVLDQTDASGPDADNNLTESYGTVYAYNSQVYYVANWAAQGSLISQLVNKPSTLNSIKADGSAKKTIKSFALASGSNSNYESLDLRVKSPDVINMAFYNGTSTNFYTYSNGQVKDNSSLTNDTYYSASYPTYLESPSDDQTFWGEPRDGKNTLFIGDASGQNAKQIATLSDYSPYGWYSNDYLLVSKNSSELYIMSKSGGDAIKITDYHKPANNYPGYGGGYGGL